MEKKKQKQKIIIGVIIALVAVVIVGIVVLVLSRGDAEEAGADDTAATEELEEVYGFVEPETVETLVAKFNAKVVDQTGWELVPADDATMAIHEENYWYPLDEDVALVVVPKEFSGDKAKDVALTMLIYTDKDSEKREEAMEYWRYAVQANAENLSADEVTELMKEAEELRERGEMANRGGGIFVAISEGEEDGHMEFQVVRNYRES